MMCTNNRVHYGPMVVFVCTLHYRIIIIMQTYLKVSYFKNACHVHYVECVSKIMLIL